MLNIREEKGLALVPVMIVALLVFLLGMAVFTLGVANKKMLFYHRDNMQAYYNAGAGIEWTMARKKADPEWPGTVPGELDLIPGEGEVDLEINVDITVEDEKEIFHIESTGYHGHGKCTVTAEIVFNENIEIISWEEKIPVLKD